MLHNDRFAMTVFRRPVPGPRPAIGLTASWDGQDDAVVLFVADDLGQDRLDRPLAVRVEDLVGGRELGQQPELVEAPVDVHL